MPFRIKNHWVAGLGAALFALAISGFLAWNLLTAAATASYVAFGMGILMFTMGTLTLVASVFSTARRAPDDPLPAQDYFGAAGTIYGILLLVSMGIADPSKNIALFVFVTIMGLCALGSGLLSLGIARSQQVAAKPIDA